MSGEAWKRYGRPRSADILTRRQWVESWVDSHCRSGDEPRDRAVADELRALWAVLDAAEDIDLHCYTVTQDALRDAIDAYYGG